MPRLAPTLEHVHLQRNAAALQVVMELRDKSGGCEPADHAALLVEPFLPWTVRPPSSISLLARV